MTPLLFGFGLVLLLGGADLLVRGAARLATRAGIQPLIVGLTVVSIGTSAPELGVTIAAVYRGDPDLALGNVVGSNIMNVLLILGLSAAFAPLVVPRRVIRFEVPLLIALSLLVFFMALNGRIGRLEGGFLLAIGLAYTATLVRQARRDAADDRPVPRSRPGMAPPERSRRAALHVALDGVFVMGGLAVLILGSHLVVDSARDMAAAMGITELAIGLTVVAVGTSLPELATSVVASIRGERDIAVGNVVGSNLFNLVIVLGAGAAASPDGVAAALTAISFDIPVMVIVAVACFPIFMTGQMISRGEGGLLLAFFGAYTAYVLLAAFGHPLLAALHVALVYVALPVAALVLATGVVRELRDRRA